MNVTGKQFINGQWVDGTQGSYQAVNPATAALIEPAMTKASSAQVEEAVRAAEAAFAVYRDTPLEERAKFLECCADEIEALGDVLSDRVSAETGYPKARAEGERARTCGQLRMFANYIRSGRFLDARIDTAMPDRQPLPRPDLRYLNRPVGPVAVFGASNFPLAYSVAGGDTASALAAGCPVLVKGHSSHPGTCDLVAQAMAAAVQKCNMPSGVFSLLMGEGRDVGASLVKAEQVKSVGFTGSLAGGMALFELANARPEPIPVFAEMGSINPVVLLHDALAERAESLAEGFLASLTLGTGQFCVNPGLLIAIESPELDRFVDRCSALLSDTPAGVMLNNRICTAYEDGLTQFSDFDGVNLEAEGVASNHDNGYYAQARLMSTTAEYFLSQHAIHEEVFGPASLLVRCQNREELLSVVKALKGQLTGTIQCSDKELATHQELVELLSMRVGRLVVNGFPTGVEVCPAMVHGGPFPAATDSRFTSVGTAAIERFLRPICFQNYPESLLPDALRNDNPLGIPRTINGELTNDAI
jgi:alpha-ketoglutaric semialdehyde dehydrogenase